MPVPGAAPAITPRPARRSEGRSSGCPMGELLRFLGKPYVLDILHVFDQAPGPHRFVDLQRGLSISPNTLSGRLRDLVEAGLLTRTSYNEIPPRVDYQATAKAKELNQLFRHLSSWAQGNDLRATPTITVPTRLPAR